MRTENQEVQLDYEISDIVAVEDTIVVLEEIPPESEEFERNILAINQKGNQLWRVEAPDRDHRTQYFTYIKYDDGRLIANNWNSYKYFVDIDTGEIEEHKKYMK